MNTKQLRKLTVTELSIIAACEIGPTEPVALLQLAATFDTVNKAIGHLKELNLIEECTRNGRVYLCKVTQNG